MRFKHQRTLFSVLNILILGNACSSYNVVSSIWEKLLSNKRWCGLRRIQHVCSCSSFCLCTQTWIYAKRVRIKIQQYGSTKWLYWQMFVNAVQKRWNCVSVRTICVEDKIRLITNTINTSESEVYTFKDPIFNFSFRDFTARTEQEANLNLFNAYVMLVCWTQSASSRQPNGLNYDECDDIHDNYDCWSDVIYTFFFMTLSWNWKQIK
jgi:hypothetical protein